MRPNLKGVCKILMKKRGGAGFQLREKLMLGFTSVVFLWMGLNHLQLVRLYYYLEENQNLKEQSRRAVNVKKICK